MRERERERERENEMREREREGALPPVKEGRPANAAGGGISTLSIITYSLFISFLLLL